MLLSHISDSPVGEWKDPHLQSQLGGQHQQISRYHLKVAKVSERVCEVMCSGLRGRGLGPGEETDLTFPGVNNKEEKGLC